MSQFIEMFGDTHVKSDNSRQWKEVVEIINGKDYKTIQVEDGGYPVYGTGGEMARAAEAGGADGLSMINTLTGMKIDIHRQKFVLANKTGGMSGPAIHPIAVRMVYQSANAVKIPIIGMGGIMKPEDAIEFILAGATAVSVGTANFTNPRITEEIVTGIEDYMMKYGVTNIKDLVGAVHE